MARYSVSAFALSLFLTICLQSGSTRAFTGNFQQKSLGTASMPFSRISVVFSTPPEGSGEGDELAAFADPLSSNKAPVSASESDGTSYPIDVPSPILLGSSMVLAIVGVGSGFDIFADEPRFPFAINAVITAGGLSLCLGLFYASILKAQAETEEDDKRYMNGR